MIHSALFEPRLPESGGPLLAALRSRPGILLVAGRYRAEDPYVELGVKRALESRGFRVSLALPSRAMNAAGFLPEILDDPVFRKEQAILLNGAWDFQQAMRGCRLVLFSSWKGQAPLADLAHREGRLTMDFSAMTGLDHLVVGHELSLAKSPIVRRMCLASHTMSGYRQLPEERLRVVGSVLYEDPEKLAFREGLGERSAFCQRYGMDPARPIVVLFPKGVVSFRKKCRIWFADWSEAQVEAYHRWYLERQVAICEVIRQSGCNPLVKLHPSSYAAYWGKTDAEYAYWQAHPWIPILIDRHTLAMFRHMDLGVGINTHSAMDAAYFGKPFLYVDSDLAPPPPLPGFHASEQFSALPPGPSSQWHAPPEHSPNPWFSSWLGGFCRLEELAGRLRDPAVYRVDPEHLAMVIGEFWYRNDGHSAGRIVEEVCQAWRGSDKTGWRRWRTLAAWRGLYQDGKGWLARWLRG
ncbi:MAG: hypothetical protein HQL95_07200 [Magnetococcales bacterium]|nr:hypothetical protein [Magnetococcales bacterium]